MEIISSAFNFNRHYRGGTARMRHRPSNSSSIKFVTAVAIKDYQESKVAFGAGGH